MVPGYLGAYQKFEALRRILQNELIYSFLKKEVETGVIPESKLYERYHELTYSSLMWLRDSGGDVLSGKFAAPQQQDIEVEEETEDNTTS